MSDKSDTPVCSPLKWHGGKSYLAKRIIELMPSHTHYVEPYAGGLSVLLAKDPEGVSEVVNDLNQKLFRFWNMLRTPEAFGKFVRIIQATPFSEEHWKWAERADDLSPPENDEEWVLEAVNFFIHCRQSLAGRMESFAPLSRNRTRRGMNEQASAWLGAVEGLPAVHERLKRVVILNRDALDVIRQQDGPNTLFYLDPPYLKGTRTSPDVYAHEMSEEQHGELLETLGATEFQGKFLLSGYRSDLYDDWAGVCGWVRHDFQISNHAAGGGSKRKMTECVWANFVKHN